MGKKGGTRRRLTKKVNSLRGASAAAKNEAPENKFNFRTNKRLKHEVAGRRIRGQSSNLPEVRARQENERKSTLLVEYKNLNRANAFVDKRVGEMDDTISKEDKALMRYQRQRQKQFAKTSRFNLEDSDEEAVVETYGQNLGSWDEDPSSAVGGGDDGAESDEYEVDEEMGGFRLKSAAGSDGAPMESKGPKTKREILQEVISKNRFYRAQRAQEKEEFEEEIDELDEGLDDVMSLLNAHNEEVKQNKIPKQDQIEIESYDDYDKSRRLMINEARAAATAKRKDNPQTRMKEARQKLIQHERLRLDSGAAPKVDEKMKKKQDGVTRADIAEKRQAHELEEETNEGASATTKVPFTPECPQTATEFTEKIEEYCGNSLKDLDTYLRHIRIMHSIIHDPKNGKKLNVFIRLLTEKFVESLPTDSDRAKTLSLHIWKVAQEIPVQASKVFVACIERFCTSKQQVANNDDDDDDDSGDDSNAGSSNQFIDVPQLGLLRLTTIVFDLEWSGRFLRQLALLVLGRALVLSGRHNGPQNNGVVPLWRGICACSITMDLVDRAKVSRDQIDESRDGGDLGVTHGANDFVPEVLVFLHAALERIILSIAGSKGRSLKQADGQGPMVAQFSEAAMLCFPGSLKWQWVGKDTSGETGESDNIDWTTQLIFNHLLRENSRLEVSNGLSGSAVGAALSVLERSVQKWSSLPSFPELLTPFVQQLKDLQAAISAKGVKCGAVIETCKGLTAQLQRRLDNARSVRKPLIRSKVVRAVEQYAPAFDETGFNPKKSNNPAADYIKGLKQKARQERKNAARELRRDAAFVSAVRDEEQAKRDLRVKRKVNDAMVFLQEQESTYKQMVKQGMTRGAGSGGGGVKKKKRF